MKSDSATNSRRVMKSLIFMLRLPVLVIAVAVCAVAAGVFSLSLGHYHAMAALELKDPVTFSVIRPDLRSTDVLARFARARGLSSSPEARALEQELARGAETPLKITNEFLITRASLRDVPDAASTKLSQNAERSNVAVSATARTPELAVKMVKFGIGFVRWILVQRALTDDLRKWQNLRNSLADLDATLLRTKADIASIDRSIAQMTKLRQSSEIQNSDVQGSAGASSGSAIQIQIPQLANDANNLPPRQQIIGLNYLPPRQQIIGLQSQRIDSEEALRKTEDDKLHVKTLQVFGAELASLLTPQSDPLKVLDAALARAETLRAQSTAIPEQSAYDNVISLLVSAKKLFVDLPTSPPDPYVYRFGLGVASSAAIGGMIGILLWIAFLYGLHLWEAHQAAGREEGTAPKVFSVGGSDNVEPRRMRAASVEYDR